MKVATLATLSATALAASLFVQIDAASAAERRPTVRAPVTGTFIKLCRSGYQTETANITPPDDTVNDNTPALSVTVSKGCNGVAIADFTSEVTGVIHLAGRATCTGTGGFTSPCTVGSTVAGQPGPGHLFLQTSSTTGTESHAAQFVFPGLARGIWRIDILPGNGSVAGGNLGFRSLVVTFHVGG